jgi:UDP-2-acetamido-2,6-beta-L-arabino-hexul-4-ose reductase
MNILITGSKGFIGKNLVAELKNRNYKNIFEYDKDSDKDILDQYCKEADFVFHLAGVNRPTKNSEFMSGNFGFTSLLLEKLSEFNNHAPVVLSSSIQACLDNPYGKSKKAGEELLIDYGKKRNVKTYIYRFPNVFGKWCKPNYNSVVATFCHNIANDLPIQINNPAVNLNLVYIDDLLKEMINALEGHENRNGDFCEVSVIHEITLGELSEKIISFRDTRKKLSIPKMSDHLTKKLYSTYLSYLPKNEFSYDLKMNVDKRGSFTEFIRTTEKGQVSVNVSKPGIVKGNHWHHTKNEKFLVVSGKGVIRFRRIDSDEIIEYFVSGDKLEVVDIPVGYTHNIENTGDTDMVTIIWVNEPFDPEKPDTYYLEVDSID